MVRGLVDSGFAYVADGHVFFDTARTPRFGALTGLPREALRDFRNDSMPAEPEELKRDSLDFLLWQPSDYPGATFDSPWGAGRPGWHVECSAMANDYLGARIDIHGGGTDLAYPHHDSEIVQSESSTGAAPYVGSWMHIAEMQLDSVKMSKSLGNLVKVERAAGAGPHARCAAPLPALEALPRTAQFSAGGARRLGAARRHPPPGRRRPGRAARRAAGAASAQRIHGGDGR